MVEKTNKLLASTIISAVYWLSSSSSLAGDWDINSNLGLTGTYTDNVELTNLDTQSSLVRQFIIGADASFTSKKLNFSFAGTETLVGYSHNSEFNDDYQTLQSKVIYDLWDNKLKLIANSSIENVSRSDFDNSLADLISGDTIQQINHSGGFQFDTNNSDYSLSSSLIYSQLQTEDEIGESNGYTATLKSENGTAARLVFWQIDGSFVNRKNNGFTRENYQFETKLGAITPYRINPFVRFYNERVSGTATGSYLGATPSWGPGIRLQAAKHFIIDLSYNYVDDDAQASDDYIAADIDWQLSPRTSIKAGYSQRFFGDSYGLAFAHKNKRVTNTISYIETVEVFDRNNYQQVESDLWCPIAAVNISECLPVGEVPDDSSNYQSFPVNTLEIEENNEFSLNKRLAWQSTLALARTSFIIDLSNRERESLSTGIIDNYFDARFTMKRRISPKSDISIYVNYSKNVFDKDNPEGARQNDIYKTLSTTYNRGLASSLNAFLTLQYIDRQSNLERYIYSEARASINLTKDF